MPKEISLEYHYFICGGYCFWRMPQEDTSGPPEQTTHFIGSYIDAHRAGWQLAPADSRFAYGNEPIYLCPECAKQLENEGEG